MLGSVCPSPPTTLWRETELGPSGSASSRGVREVFQMPSLVPGPSAPTPTPGNTPPSALRLQVCLPDSLSHGESCSLPLDPSLISLLVKACEVSLSGQP